MALITNHTFIRGKDGRCDYTWYTYTDGSGWGRERCGNAVENHGTPPDRTAAGIDRRPHSRACGILPHAHGTDCHSNCPTCGGTVSPEPKPFADPLKAHESTKRVLFHVVNAYQTWRDVPNMLPNELTDDAVRIGEQHLREVDWFPQDGGWLADGTSTHPYSYYYEPTPKDNVLTLIDNELERLREPDIIGRGKWRRGVLAARQTAAHQLQKIRDAYVVESLSRETEALRLYGIQEEPDDVR